MLRRSDSAYQWSYRQVYAYADIQFSVLCYAYVYEKDLRTGSDVGEAKRRPLSTKLELRTARDCIDLVRTEISDRPWAVDAWFHLFRFIILIILHRSHFVQTFLNYASRASHSRVAFVIFDVSEHLPDDRTRY